MLMRFSALTFNSHLIHFDQLYTQREEGYPERVVHGTLVAVILAQLMVLNGTDRIHRFEFRARSPLYVNQPIQFMGKLESDRVVLRATGVSGMLAMEATAWLGGSRRGFPLGMRRLGVDLGGVGPCCLRFRPPGHARGCGEPAETVPQWDQALQLLADKDWPRGIAALRVIIDAKSFVGLPPDARYKALSTAGKVIVHHGTLQPGYEYLVRATAMPDATFSDWLERLQAARRAYGMSVIPPAV
jgi:hypothetical protein